jgi:hypothetical protein
VAGDQVRRLRPGCDRPLPGAQRDERRHHFPADRQPPGTTWREWAADRLAALIRRRSLDRDELLGSRLVEARDRVQQANRVGVGRCREELLGRRRLDDESGVHHVDPLGHSRHDTEIVRDQDHCRARVRRQPPEELEHLGLDRHVEGRRRFVGDHQLRLERERHRDHHALPHSAGELMGIAPEAILRSWNSDHAQELHGSLAGLVLRRLAVSPDRLDHLLFDRQDRVQAGHGVLEDHRDVAAAEVAHVVLRQRREVELVEQDRAALDAPGGLRQQPHDRQIRHALAAAGLADEAQRLALLDVERHAVDGVDRALVGSEADDQVLNGKQGHRQRFIRGSSDSRRPSPSRLKPIALSEIAAPVKKMIQGAWR